jgi:hypothetical protein
LTEGSYVQSRGKAGDIDQRWVFLDRIVKVSDLAGAAVGVRGASMNRYSNISIFTRATKLTSELASRPEPGIDGLSGSPLLHKWVY